MPLGAVLELARVKRDTPRDILNVLVEGLDSVKVNRPISLAKAFEDDTLLAYAMNGEPVPAGPRLSGAGDRARLGRHQQHQVGGAHRGAEAARSTCPPSPIRSARSSWRRPPATIEGDQRIGKDVQASTRREKGP